MGKKNKSKFKKFFSLKRHLRRLNAKKLSSMIDLDFKSQKKSFIHSGNLKYTHGSSDNLALHFKNLEQEFSGKPELEFTHAKIIVLLRREYKTRKYFKIFIDLWEKETSFLLKNLSIRWLMSAADTFADFSEKDSEKAAAVACSCLVNTIKLQESEIFLSKRIDYDFDKGLMQKLEDEHRFALFDGLSVFKYGTDDTLRNMRWRIDKLANECLVGKILLEIFRRLQNHNSTYYRAKKLHYRNQTEWW